VTNIGYMTAQSDQSGQLPRKDNRIRLRPDVYKSLGYYIAEQSSSISGVPGVKMDENDVVSEIVMNFLAEKGHYPPKDVIE
jgi:hypothetical protein